MGASHSIHANISSTGSVRGMCDRGYWGKKDRAVRAGSFTYNIDSIVSDENPECDKVLKAACRCAARLERRKEKPKSICEVSNMSDNLSEEDIDFLNEYILETYSDEVSKLSVFRDIHPFDFEFDVAPFFLLEAQKKERAEENSRSSIQLPQDATFGRYDFTGYSAPGFYIDNLPKPIVLPLKDITLHNDGAKVSPRFAYAIGEDYSAGAWDAKATLVKGMPKKEKSKTQNAPCR